MSKKDCKHNNKAYSSMGITLTCYPPINITKWICKDCGEQGEERSQSTISTEYEETLKKFNLD